MKTLKIKLPTCWNELSEAQLEDMMLLFHSQGKGQQFDVAVFLILMGGASRKTNTILQEVPLSELKKHYAFIYTDINRTVFVKEWKVDGVTYHAPGDRLNNLSAEEYAVAEDLQFRYRKTRKLDYLHLMAAVLYVPQKGLRPVFEKLLLEEKAQLFADLPTKKLLAMEMAFFGSKNHIVDKFPTAYPKKAPVTTSAQKKYGFGKVILNMAGGKFGNHEQTRRTNIYTFLEEFEDNLKQSANAKR